MHPRPIQSLVSLVRTPKPESNPEGSFLWSEGSRVERGSGYIVRLDLFLYSWVITLGTVGASTCELSGYKNPSP